MVSSEDDWGRRIYATRKGHSTVCGNHHGMLPITYGLICENQADGFEISEPALFK